MADDINLKEEKDNKEDISAEDLNNPAENVDENKENQNMSDQIVQETGETNETDSTVAQPEVKTDETKTLESESEKTKRSIKQEGKRGWYVIHTYSGYEDQVAESLKQRIESMGMKGFIFSVIVPIEKQIEIKNGKRSVVEKKIFPGYVLVEMNVTDESWYVVRNTPNVTGFVGFGVRPTPMSEEEIARIQKRMSVQEPKHKIEFKIDDLVRIVDGPLKGFEGKVTDIDEGKGKIKVSVNMFGRETPANIDFLQAKKV